METIPTSGDTGRTAIDSSNRYWHTCCMPKYEVVFNEVIDGQTFEEVSKPFDTMPEAEAFAAHALAAPLTHRRSQGKTALIRIHDEDEFETYREIPTLDEGDL